MENIPVNIILQDGMQERMRERAERRFGTDPAEGRGNRRTQIFQTQRRIKPIWYGRAGFCPRRYYIFR